MIPFHGRVTILFLNSLHNTVENKTSQFHWLSNILVDTSVVLGMWDTGEYVMMSGSLQG